MPLTSAVEAKGAQTIDSLVPDCLKTLNAVLVTPLSPPVVDEDFALKKIS